MADDGGSHDGAAAPDPGESAEELKRPDLTAASESSAASRLKKWRQWLRARPLRCLSVAAAAVLIPALGVFGHDMAQGIVNSFGHHSSSRTPPRAGGQSGRVVSEPPLGVSTTVSYSDATGVGLAEPIASGRRYAELLGGLTDFGAVSWASFLAQNPGAPIGELHVDIVVIDQARTAIRITNLEIRRIGSATAPLAGTFVPIPHAGAQAAYQFVANMDAPNPVITPVGGGQTFPDLNFQLAPGAPYTLSIRFMAAKYASRWTLVLSYLVGSTLRTLDLNEPNGQPFAVTAAAKAYRVRYVSNFPASGFHLAG
jgi:hypothetical protein